MFRPLHGHTQGELKKGYNNDSFYYGCAYWRSRIQRVN